MGRRDGSLRSGRKQGRCFRDGEITSTVTDSRREAQRDCKIKSVRALGGMLAMLAFTVPRWLQLQPSHPSLLCPKAERRGTVKRALPVSLNFYQGGRSLPKSPLIFLDQNRVIYVTRCRLVHSAPSHSPSPECPLKLLAGDLKHAFPSLPCSWGSACDLASTKLAVWHQTWRSKVNE